MFSTIFVALSASSLAAAATTPANILQNSAFTWQNATIESNCGAATITKGVKTYVNCPVSLLSGWSAQKHSNGAAVSTFTVEYNADPNVKAYVLRVNPTVDFVQSNIPVQAKSYTVSLSWTPSTSCPSSSFQTIVGVVTPSGSSATSTASFFMAASPWNNQAFSVGLQGLGSAGGKMKFSVVDIIPPNNAGCDVLIRGLSVV